MKNTHDEFFSKIIRLLKECAEICYSEIKEIKCITCPCKAEGSFFMMVRQIEVPFYIAWKKIGWQPILQVKLDKSQLSDISDDVDFCRKLAKEESVMVLPGTW